MRRPWGSFGGSCSALAILLCFAAAAQDDSPEICRAARARDLARVQTLVAGGANVNARDRAGRTPLLLAMEGSASEYKVIGADEDLARFLVEHGADVNARDAEGWSPLLKAVDLWADQPE